MTSWIVFIVVILPIAALKTSQQQQQLQPLNNHSALTMIIA